MLPHALADAGSGPYRSHTMADADQPQKRVRRLKPAIPPLRSAASFDTLEEHKQYMRERRRAQESSRDRTGRARPERERARQEKIARARLSAPRLSASTLRRDAAARSAMRLPNYAENIFRRKRSFLRCCPLLTQSISLKRLMSAGARLSFPNVA